MMMMMMMMMMMNGNLDFKQFLYKIMKAFGIGPAFIHWICQIYSQNCIIYKTLINHRTNCGSNLKLMYQINTPFSVMYILFALDYRVNISSYSE